MEKEEKEIKTFGDLGRIVRRMQSVIDYNMYQLPFDLDNINKVITNMKNSDFNKLIENFSIDTRRYSVAIINEIEYQANQLLKICKNLETKEDLLELKFKIEQINKLKAKLEKEI